MTLLNALDLTPGQGWRAEAACRDYDPEIFFPEDENPAAKAKAICATCPVRMECLDWAIRNREPEGIWGGMTAAERRRVRRQRQKEAARVA